MNRLTHGLLSIKQAFKGVLWNSHGRKIITISMKVWFQATVGLLVTRTILKKLKYASISTLICSMKFPPYITPSEPSYLFYCSWLEERLFTWRENTTLVLCLKSTSTVSTLAGCWQPRFSLVIRTQELRKFTFTASRWKVCPGSVTGNVGGLTPIKHCTCCALPLERLELPKRKGGDTWPWEPESPEHTLTWGIPKGTTFQLPQGTSRYNPVLQGTRQWEGS